MKMDFVLGNVLRDHFDSDKLFLVDFTWEIIKNEATGHLVNMDGVCVYLNLVLYNKIDDREQFLKLKMTKEEFEVQK